MKRWLVAAALAVAGCQTPTTATTQEIETQDCYGVGNFCGAKMPPATSWLPGDPFPQSTPTTVVMLMRESQAVWQVFGADPVNAKIHWRLTMKPTAVGPFMILITNLNQPYGGVRPPPIGCPPVCIEPPAFVLAAALRNLDIQAQAEADADACPLK